MEALKTEKVDAILVDMYTPAKRKDLFNGSWFEVSKLLKTDISQGVVLQGAALNLADELYKSVLEQNVQTQYLLEVKEKGENSEVSQRHHYNLRSPWTTSLFYDHSNFNQLVLFCQASDRQ